MKLPQISMIIGLAVLLNFSIPTTWADKKTAIIAGSASGGAVTVIGGALWYKLRNYNGKVEVTIDGEKLAIENSDPKLFSTDLLEHGINSTTIEELENKMNELLSNYNELLSNHKEENLGEKWWPDDEEKIFKISIDTNGEKIEYKLTENNKPPTEGFINKNDKKVSEISPVEPNETPYNLGIIDQNETPDQPKTSTDTENIEPNTELADVSDILFDKLRKQNTEVKYYYDGKLLNVKNNNLDQLVNELKSKGVTLETTIELKAEIDIICDIKKIGKSVDVYIRDGENGKLIFSMKSGNEFIVKNRLLIEELNNPIEANKIIGDLNNLGIIDQNKISDQPKTSTDTENIDPYTESTNVMDTAENLENETGNLEEVVTD